MDSSDTLELTADLSELTTADSDTLSVASYRTPDTSGTDGYDWPSIVVDHVCDEVIHETLPASKRIGTVAIRDAHDTVGSGMMFTLRLATPFKNAFSAFKAASCKSCRPVDDIRFKVGAKKLKYGDTPKDLDGIHGETISITALPEHQRQAHGPQPPARQPRSAAAYPAHPPSVPGPELQDDWYRDDHDEQMRTVLGEYARRAECELRSLYFFFSGEAVAYDDTPEDMGMKTDSVIEVKMHVHGV